MYTMQPWDSQTAALAICALNHLIASSHKLHRLDQQCLVGLAAVPVVAMTKPFGNECIPAAGP